MTDQELFDMAVAFARPYHEAKQPGYFDDHVMAVVREVRKHTTNITVIIAAIFHDLLEDTDCTGPIILERFGYAVYWFTECLTDEPGKNRKERKWKTYHKIRRDRFTILIKLCDRLDNLRRSMRDDSQKYNTMYLHEDMAFRSALWDNQNWPNVWEDYFDLIDLKSRQISRSASNA